MLLSGNTYWDKKKFKRDYAKVRQTNSGARQHGILPKMWVSPRTKEGKNWKRSSVGDDLPEVRLQETSIR